MCHNAAMELMRTNASRAAGRILRQCEDFLAQRVGPSVKKLILTKGIMHTVYNNLAQHANMTADMDLSIEYLEKALQAAEHPETDQDLLPLAETYLNLANGYSFLSRFEQALFFAEKATARTSPTGAAADEFDVGHRARRPSITSASFSTGAGRPTKAAILQSRISFKIPHRRRSEILCHKQTVFIFCGICSGYWAIISQRARFIR